MFEGADGIINFVLILAAGGLVAFLTCFVFGMVVVSRFIYKLIGGK